MAGQGAIGDQGSGLGVHLVQRGGGQGAGQGALGDQGSGLGVHLVQREGGQGAGQGALGDQGLGLGVHLVQREGGRAGGRLGLLRQLGVVPVQAAHCLPALRQLLLRAARLRPCRHEIAVIRSGQLS